LYEINAVGLKVDKGGETLMAKVTKAAWPESRRRRNNPRPLYIHWEATHDQVKGDSDASLILKTVYGSRRVRQLLARKTKVEELKEAWRTLETRRLILDGDGKSAKAITLIIGLGGRREVLSFVSFCAITFRALHRIIRQVCGLPERASSTSICVRYCGHMRLPGHPAPDFSNNEIIPCSNDRCRRRTQGTILQVVMHGTVAEKTYQDYLANRSRPGGLLS
jgi:hypothetical protein